MASLSIPDVTVDCPVCGQRLTVLVEVRKVIYSRVDPDDETVTMRADLHLALVEGQFDAVGHDHADCFTVTDEDRASIAAYETAAGRDAEGI